MFLFCSFSFPLGFYFVFCALPVGGAVLAACNTHTERAQVQAQQRHEHEDEEDSSSQLQQMFGGLTLGNRRDAGEHAASFLPALSEEEEQAAAQSQVPEEEGRSYRDKPSGGEGAWPDQTHLMRNLRSHRRL